jgi:hypothetical protein
MNFALEDINEIMAAQNAELVEIKAQMSPNEEIEKKFSHLEATYEQIEIKVIQLEKTNIQMIKDFKEHVSPHLFIFICILCFIVCNQRIIFAVSKQKNEFSLICKTLRVQSINYLSLVSNSRMK